MPVVKAVPASVHFSKRRIYGQNSRLFNNHPLKESEMKLSARNQLKGKIVEVTKGATTSHVRVEIGPGVVITASITNEAVADLALQKGDAAWAVIKASDVMVGK
jgi:molybdopterin-binding protein